MAQLLTQKIDAALSAVDQFSAFLEKETAALQKSDYRAFEAMQDQKYSLAQSYQDAILSFEEDVEALPNLPEDIKQKLRAAHTRFSAAADVNQIALETAAKISTRVVDLIIDAAKRSVSDTPNYSAAGSQGLSEKIPVHFKLNEVL